MKAGNGLGIGEVDDAYAVLGGVQKALNDLHTQWSHLAPYLEDSGPPIDNNRAENDIRRCVVGPKTSFFATSLNGAKASTNLYSLIQTAKSNGLEPNACPRCVFAERPNPERHHSQAGTPYQIRLDGWGDRRQAA